MATQIPQQSENGIEAGGSTGITPNTSLSGQLQVRRHQLVHRRAANVATKNMTEDAHLTIVRKTGNSKNKEQHAIGCKYIDIMSG
jgi:hypothetical protein